MLQRLCISNFRGLRDVKVDDLGRINLVTGRNNAGKTTLLEALFLLVGAANARMAFNPHVIRGWRPGIPPRWIAETYWKPLFSGLDIDRGPGDIRRPFRDRRDDPDDQVGQAIERGLLPR